MSPTGGLDVSLDYETSASVARIIMTIATLWTISKQMSRTASAGIWPGRCMVVELKRDMDDQMLERTHMS